MLVQQGDEPLIVMRLDEVNEFVNDEIFEALHRLFRQFEVQPDAASRYVARAPLSLHLFDAPSSDLNVQACLPFRDKRGNPHGGGASMGPRSYERGRRWLSPTCITRYCDEASMGPRSHERGRKCWNAIDRPSCTMWLQRGRVHKNAERDAERACTGGELAASMGPRSFERGRYPLVVDDLHGIASMGPRSFERGKMSTAKLTACHVGAASMGPRSFERGRAIIAGSPGSAGQLASMGPRS